MPISVLIVDDDEGSRQALADLLLIRGYRVVGEAASAKEALAQAVELNPDAVLLDVNLPDGDGAAVAASLRAMSGSPNVLLMSADPMAVPQPLLERSGARGFVAKTKLAAANLDHYLKR